MMETSGVISTGKASPAGCKFAVLHLDDTLGFASIDQHLGAVRSATEVSAGRLSYLASPLVSALDLLLLWLQ